MRSSADAVLFEFDSHRQEALKLRADVREWQPQLRTLLLLQITLAHMRLREPSGILPATVEQLSLACAEELDGMAAMLESWGLRKMPEGRRSAEREALNAGALKAGSVAESIAMDSLVIAQDLSRQIRSASESGT